MLVDSFEATLLPGSVPALLSARPSRHVLGEKNDSFSCGRRGGRFLINRYAYHCTCLPPTSWVEGTKITVLVVVGRLLTGTGWPLAGTG